MESEELRARLEDTRRIERIRRTYHWVIGEVIRFQLAFTDAPEITVTENHADATVTTRLDAVELTLTDDGDYRTATETMRAWIDSHIDISRLTRSKHHAPGAAYWRTRTARR